MDYLQLQADAKDENRNLLVVFAVIIAVVAATAAGAVAATIWATLWLIEAFILADASSVGRDVAESELLVDRTPWSLLYLGVFVTTAAVIAWVSRSRERALIAFGGAGIARSLGGRRIDSRSRDSAERRFVNAVEEMSIAARRTAPMVYVLDGEVSINAFNAGWTDETTVIGVTSGALTELRREEQQAVAAQAMSHVFHGDARLNLRLMALVTGVAGLAMIGEDWMERAKPSFEDDDDGLVLPLYVGGSLLYAVGWIGVWLSTAVQRSVARRHELLADATAIELLRQGEPMRDALRRIGGHPAKGRIRHRRARSVNHLFMVDAGGRRRGGVHPDLRLRVLRLDASWKGDWLRPDRSPDVSPHSTAPVVASPIPPTVADNPVPSSLGPITPVLDAMSGVLPGLSPASAGLIVGTPLLDEGSIAASGAGVLAPMIGASLLAEVVDTPTGPTVDVDRARTVVSALVHLAIGATPTESTTPAACSVATVAAQIEVLRQLPSIDRPGLLAEVGAALGSSPDSVVFAEEAVAVLQVDEDLDQWMLRRLVLGNVVPPREHRRRRSLERLRHEYAVVLSSMTAIGGGDAATAFAVGAARADLLGIHRRRPGRLSSLERALHKLAAMDVDDQARALAGLEAAMEADGASRRAELEFVEVVRLALSPPSASDSGVEATASRRPSTRSWRSRLRQRPAA